MQRMGLVDFTRLMLKAGVQVLSEGIGTADPNALPLALWLLYHTEHQVVQKDDVVLLVFVYECARYVHQEDGAAYAYVGEVLSFAPARAIGLACELLQHMPVSLNACHIPLVMAKFNLMRVSSPPRLTAFDREHDAGTHVAV